MTPSMSTFLFSRLFPGSIIIGAGLFCVGMFDINRVDFVDLFNRDGWKGESPGSSLGTVVELHELIVDGTTPAGDVPCRLQHTLALGAAPDASHVEIEPDSGTLDDLFLPFAPLRAQWRCHYHARPLRPCTAVLFSGVASGRASPSRLSRDR